MTIPEIVSPELADMKESKGAPHEMLPQQLKNVRAMLNRSLYAFCWYILRYADLDPNFHLSQCEFIELWGTPTVQADGRVLRLYDRLMNQQPRGTYKSSVGTIGNAFWQISKEPDQPIAIVNEAADKPRQWIRSIRETVETSDLYQVVYADLIPRGVAKRDNRPMHRNVMWSDHALNFEGRRIGDPEPSIAGYGMESATTGHHCPKWIIDDLISEKHRDSPQEMARVDNWLLNHLKLGRPANSGMFYVNCTPWTYGDGYTKLIKEYNYSLYRRSALENEKGEPDMGGKPTFNGFTRESLIADARRDFFTFTAQMMCRPLPGRNIGFNYNWIRRFTLRDGWIYIGDDDYQPLVDDQGVPAPRKIHLSQLRKAILWDPAPSEQRDRKREPKARNGLVVEGIDPWERRFILQTLPTKDPPREVLGHIFAMEQRWQVTDLIVEEVVFSSLYRHWINDLKRTTYRSSNLVARPAHTQGAHKDKRIQDKAIGWKEGRYYLNRVDVPGFESEFCEFPHGDTRDLLDAMGYDHYLTAGPSAWAESEIRDRQADLEAEQDDICAY